MNLKVRQPLRPAVEVFRNEEAFMVRHLIAGGAGFIGSNLAELLLNRGEHVSVIDNLSTGRFSNIATLEKNDRSGLFVDDVRDEDLIEELVREADLV
jgi:UDP-glucose 4-epimerase